MGSGCGSVGRAVASNTRDPRFEFRHLGTINCIKTVLNRWKLRKKGLGMAQLKNPIINSINCRHLIDLIQHCRFGSSYTKNILFLRFLWSQVSSGFEPIVITPWIGDADGPVLILILVSVTSKKPPNVYKSCPKMISLEKWMILTPLHKLHKNLSDFGLNHCCHRLCKVAKVQ